MALSLAEESEARKARLQALRDRKEGNRHGAIGLLSQRNFDPETRTLRKHTAAVNGNEETVENTIAGLTQTILATDEARQAAELDLLNIAPKRANWDLKRDLEKKMIPLEKKTKEAIYTLVRQRLGRAKDDSKDIAGAIKAREDADKFGDDNDDDEEEEGDSE